jgi:hypothetical protein
MNLWTSSTSADGAECGRRFVIPIMNCLSYYGATHKNSELLFALPSINLQTWLTSRPFALVDTLHYTEAVWPYLSELAVNCLKEAESIHAASVAAYSRCHETNETLCFSFGFAWHRPRLYLSLSPDRDCNQTNRPPRPASYITLSPPTAGYYLFFLFMPRFSSSFPR